MKDENLNLFLNEILQLKSSQEQVVFNFALTNPRAFVEEFPYKPEDFLDIFYDNGYFMKQNIWISSRENNLTKEKRFRIRFVKPEKFNDSFKYIEYEETLLEQETFDLALKEFSLSEKCSFRFRRYYLSKDEFTVDVTQLAEDKFYVHGRIIRNSESIPSIKEAIVHNQSNYILPVRSKVMEYLYHTDSSFYNNELTKVINGAYYSDNIFKVYPRLHEVEDLALLAKGSVLRILPPDPNKKYFTNEDWESPESSNWDDLNNSF